MKRSLVAIIACAALCGAVALTVSCSKKSPLGLRSQRVTVEKDPAYTDHGVAVYRIPGQPDRLAVRTTMFAALDASGAPGKPMTWDEAMRTLDDAADVHLVGVWQTIAAADFDASRGLKRHAPGTPMEIDPGLEGGGDPPDPGCGGCWCCVPANGACSCSWGCIKKCWE